MSDEADFGNVYRQLAEIKDELKGMRELMERTIRVEERLATTQEENSRLRGELSKIYERLSTIETSNALGRRSIGNIERAGWIGFAGLLSWVVGHFRG